MEAIDPQKLRQFLTHVLCKHGLPKRSATVVSTVLVEADLRGISSHGVERFPAYLNRLVRHQINPLPNIHVVRDAPSLALLDGDNGMGPVVARKAMQLAIRKARLFGVAGVAVKNSNHFGIAAYYAELAARHQCIGLAASNAIANMALYGGQRPILGTNPVAFAVPIDDAEPPFVADMAMSQAARGKILLAKKRRAEIPSGWAIDIGGNVTTEPARALEGAVLPFGDHKGSALAILIEVLCGPMSGGRLSSQVSSLYDETSKSAGVGHFFLALSVLRLDGQDTFKHMMARLLRSALDSAPHASRQFRLPGTRSQTTRSRRIAEGIPLCLDCVNELRVIGQDVDVEFPLALGRPS